MAIIAINGYHSQFWTVPQPDEYKIEKPRARKSSRLNSFSHRVVSAWNGLPADIVNAKNVVAFKTGLDKLWRGKRYEVTDIY